MKKSNSFRILAFIWLLTFSFTLIGCDSNKTVTPQQPPQTQSTYTAPAPVQQVAPTPVETPKVIEHKIMGSGPNGEGIKGHIDKKGVKIYHLPGDPYYNRTTHVAQWFFTTKDAEAAGYRAIIR